MKLALITIVAGAICSGTLNLEAQDRQSGSASEAEPRFAKGATFLTRLRFADPDYRLILIACLKENELNLLLSRHVTAPEIPVLVKGLLSQLSATFPGETLSVVAFRPIVPLREAGIARFNPTTREISYWTEVPPKSTP